MASRRARLAQSKAKTTTRTEAAKRVTEARTEIAHRSLLAAADRYADLPLFRAVALDLGVVPDPAPVPVEALTSETRLLPVVTPGSLLGLMDNPENGATPMSATCEGCRGSGGNWDCGGQNENDENGCECEGCTGCEACPECNGCGRSDCNCHGQCHAEIGCCNDDDGINE